MSTPLRLATALLVPWLLLAGCGDDEPESSEPSSEPSSELSSEATDESTSETSEPSEPTESATRHVDRGAHGHGHPRPVRDAR